MKKLFNKRIPTILGIIIVLLGIPLTTFLIKNQTVLKSRALNSQDPQNVKVTNISDKSFTITYQTDIPTTGSISYGDDKKLGKSELEDADKEKGSFSPKKIHSISVKKLIPTTKYYFAIISGSNTFLNNDTPFETTTGNNIASLSAMQNDVEGRLILPDGNTPSEALIYLNAENSQLLSSAIDKNGKFNFSLKDLRTDDLSTYFGINANTIFKIFATNGSLKSTALAYLSNVKSIPTITLSNDYNFTQEASIVASKSGESSGFPSISPGKNFIPEILNPKENQSFTERKPQFRGTSLPNETIEITINSEEEIVSQVTADSNGNWTFIPPANLSPGAHTITIKTRDSSGILTTIMQSFTVLAADSPTSTPTTPSATSSPLLFPSPAIIILTPTPTSTPTPLPTLASIESKGGLPPTGNSAFLLIAGGLATTLAGLSLLFFTRKLSL